jgi:hypothetical protein
MAEVKTTTTISYADDELKSLLLNTEILEVNNVYTLESTTPNSVYGTLTAERFVSSGVDQKYTLSTTVNNVTQTYTFGNLPSTYSLTVAVANSVNSNNQIYGKFIIGVINAFGVPITEFDKDFHLYKDGLPITIHAPNTENIQVYLYGIDAKSNVSWSSTTNTTYNASLFESGEYDIKEGNASSGYGVLIAVVLSIVVALVLIVGIWAYFKYGRPSRTYAPSGNNILGYSNLEKM